MKFCPELQFNEIFMQRINQAPSFVDAATAELGGPRTSRLLTRLDAAVDWADLAGPIRSLPMYRNTGAGRRPWDAGVMVKCVLLAKWFGLSDPMLEEMLRDRLSFRRFVGLSLEDDTPDETTFVRFRGRLREAGLDRELFERALGQLQQRGLVVDAGTLVDATILEAPRGEAKKDEAGQTVGHTRDPEASYTKKHGRSYHGYKAHVATDRRGLIRKVIYDTAKVHDANHFRGLTADEPAGGSVWADSAYMSARHESMLKGRGIYYGVVRRRVRGEDELPRSARLINRLIAKVRSAVEHPFAGIKNMGHRRTRYRGRRRNELDFTLIAIAQNFKRSLSLTPAA